MKEGDALSLPKGWELKKLSDVCEKFIVPQRDKPKEFSGTIPWCRIEDFDGRYLYKSKSDKCVSDELISSMPLRVFPINTVIVSCSADLGRCAIIKEPLVTNQTFIGLVPKEEIYPEYLHYLMGSMADYLNKIATGATIKYLSKKKFQNLEIPIPPLPEQKQIVAILDKAFAAIDQARANIEKNIENAKELFQSKLNEIFSQPALSGAEGKGDGDALSLSKGWEEKSLGELSFLKSGGTPSRSKKEYWEGGTIPWYSSGELNNTYTEQPERHITKLGLENSNARVFPKGSLLVGMYDTAALKMSIIDRDATFNQAIVGIEPNDAINLIFIMRSINSQKAEILSLRRGVRQKNLNQSKIKAITIGLPEKSIQNKIVSDLELIQNKQMLIESHYQQKLDNLDDLKKSILQKAFSGELTSTSSATTQKPVAI